ncbi:protein abnormal spindle [Sabethes cyaneus]|uniref:protein abnormal spindle n=1 Tax=Sabethes cyaneus TaxID=53552 RepID=UPI00237E7A9D|nr:protein abnormal spindle [Sabethes cyaneus]
MSAFQVSITPTRSQPKRRTESREPTLVILGPFTPKATVIFEGVPVGKTARRQMLIKNPHNEQIKVLVTKIPKAEFNISLEWTSADISSGEECQLELVWNPLKVISSKETIQISDSIGNKKDVALILKSSDSKRVAPKKTVCKQATIPRKLKLKSPSPPKQIIKRTVTMKKRESPLKKSFLTTQSNCLVVSKNNVLVDRTAANIFSEVNFSRISSEPMQFSMAADKENVSPQTPERNSNLFKGIQFTPSSKDNSHLADLPTPVNPLKTSAFLYDKTTTITKKPYISPNGDQYLRVRDIHSLPSDQSVLAMAETPKSNYKTYNASEIIGTPFNRKSSLIENSRFDPNCFSTITKEGKPLEPEIGTAESNGDINKQLNFSCEIELAESQCKELPVTSAKTKEFDSAMGSYSPCHEIQLVLLESLEGVPNEQQKILNKTQTVSTNDSHQQLSMIAEESSRDLGLTYYTSISTFTHESEELKVQQKTFHINSMIKSNSDDNIVKNLTMDVKQISSAKGSLPNLNNEDDDDARMFKEHEIRAQSSRFNLHEIDLMGDELKPILGKRVLDRNSINNGKDEPISLHISPPKKSKLESSSPTTSLTAANWWTAPKVPKSSAFNREGKYSFQVPKNLALRNLTLKKPPAPTTISKKFDIEEKRVYLYDSDQHLRTLINPDPFAATTTCDPFLTTTMYLDERSYEKYERQLKKWLNALVTIPADLDTEPNKPVDVAKLFDEVKGKELTLAPTKELISSNYYRNRLNQLRSAGISLYFNEKVAEPLRKVRAAIEKKSLVLRTDRDLHLDLVLQRNILELLLCFNPLWLRLGLEITFGEQIELQSNRDVLGLSTFIINRLFRDRYLEIKHSRAYSLSPAYAEHMKKFTLRMVLFLIFFLDTAKNQRLIKHNPCLFIKTAPYKETREILIRFSSYLIAGIGDITKHLKRFGFILTHKQTYLDEFNYAFENLAVDLRDGIRLTRVTEIILLRDDLTQSLRVPAISRLQKIHNINLALKVLEEANFQIAGDIAAKDICDGHREKTLSLLWQIVYKFRAPKFNAAANIIRNWWKKNWLKVVIGRRITQKWMQRREQAAIVIQSVYRGHQTRLHFKQMRQEKMHAAVVLQKYTRRYLTQKKAALQYASILRIQRWWRLVQTTKTVREQFLLQRKSAIVLQTSFRRHMLAKRLLAASRVIHLLQVEARIRYEKALIIQRTLKSYVIHRKLQSIVLGIVTYNRHKAVRHFSATKIQSLVRMHRSRQEFLNLRKAAVTIQRRWKECLLARKERMEFVKLKKCTIIIQQRLRGYFLMMQTKAEFTRKISTILLIQSKFKAKLAMRKERSRYLQMKYSAIVIQRRYRALIAMRHCRQMFQKLKSAALVIQRRVRANELMKTKRHEFENLKNAALKIQQQFRAKIAMINAHTHYQRSRLACIIIQRRLRATLVMRKQRMEFLAIQYYTIVLQRQFRANVTAKVKRLEFLKIRNAAICIQRKFRAAIVARHVQSIYHAKRQAAIVIQRYWRSVRLMRMNRSQYLTKRTAAITIQQRFRSYKLFKTARSNYLRIRTAVVLIQQKYRATKVMLRQRQTFQDTLAAIMLCQRCYKASLVSRKQRAEFIKLRNTAVFVQRRWRAKLAMRAQRDKYQTLRNAVLVVQRQYRALKSMKFVRTEYERTRVAIIHIQRKYIATREMKCARSQYLSLKSKAIVIQQYFRSYLKMKKQRIMYIQLKQATQCIQQQFRASKSMHLQRKQYLNQRSSAIVIQRWFRGYLKMKHSRQQFLCLKQACLALQRRYRARSIMVKEKSQYAALRCATLIIQRKWRATLTMRKQRVKYQTTIKAAYVIKQYYLAYRLRLVDQVNYRIFRSAIIIIQRKFRATQQMRIEQTRYQQLKETTVRLQARARGYLARQAFLAKLTPEYLERRIREQSAKTIQSYWRGYQHRKKHQTVTIRDIANRMIASRKNAMRDPSNRVSNILKSCMKFMKTRFAVHEAIKVLLRIEHISRLVPHLLVKDAIFLASFCYMTMAQAIRSELDKQLIEICARIILNMARYDGTKEQAFQENGLVTVSQMLLRWCDKECGIFNTLCTLLWILSHDKHKKNAIRRYMISREAIYMLRETKKLVQRKENMRKNVKKPVGCLVPPDPTLMRMKPILEPDFGVIRSKPYVFYSSVFAFDTVLNVLDVDIS